MNEIAISGRLGDKGLWNVISEHCGGVDDQYVPDAN